MTKDALEQFKISRLLLGEHKKDVLDVPVMKKVNKERFDFHKIKPLNIQNLSINKNNTDKMILSFSYDKYLERFWNDPLKYIPILQSAYSVATLDYSLNEQMAISEYLHNIYKNRWLGCLWQDCGILSVPTVGWTTAEWDYLSFSGIEKGSVVVISTLGAKRNVQYFMRGYNELIKRIAPELIIVYGDMLTEMTGRFINFKYEDSFQYKNQTNAQTVLFEVSPIFEVWR